MNSRAVIKTEEGNLLLRYLEKKEREENRILEQTASKPQLSNPLLTPTSPFRGSHVDIRGTWSDQELEDIDSSLDTPSRFKRKQVPYD